jgi:hypothetical protein
MAMSSLSRRKSAYRPVQIPEASIRHGKGGQSDAGMNAPRLWRDGPEACLNCRTNAEAGLIDIDDAFASGDIAAPGHPRCLCDAAPVSEA